MTREEARAILCESKRQNECIRDCPSTFFTTESMEAGVDNAKKRIAALDIAISALTPPTQEQMERVWTHCEHCADGKSVDGQIILCGNRGLFSMNFCPICGAPLRDKAWEEMMERLEALNDAD